MVLAAHNVLLSEKQIRDLCNWHPHTAVSSTSVVAAARALGFIGTQEDYGLRLHDLRDVLCERIFPIVGIDLQPYGLFGQHAQVVVSVTSRGIAVQDPLPGQFTTGLLVFEEAWSGSEFLAIIIR